MNSKTIFLCLIMLMCLIIIKSTFTWAAAVGIGSCAFHMTLLYYMQLLDELPMVFGNMLLIYQLAEIRKSAKKPVNAALVFGCCTYAFFFTVFYLAFKNPLIHQV